MNEPIFLQKSNEKLFVENAIQETNVDETAQTVMDAIAKGAIHFELTEDEKDDDYFVVSHYDCPYKACDGSGFTLTKVNRTWEPTECQCRKDLILQRMKKNSCIDPEFFGATLENISTVDEFLTLYRLQLRKTPLLLDEVASHYDVSAKSKSRKAVPLVWEDIPSDKQASVYMETFYERIKQERTASAFFQGYTNSIMKRLETGEQALNLCLFGEPGCAKTYISASISHAFLEKGKKVHYIRMKDLVENPESVKYHLPYVKSSDFFIFDELGGEYHKETQWALKQVQGFIKIRQEQNLPTIIITNMYPHEWNTLYQKKLMSLLNGRFLPIHVVSSIDLRPHFQAQNIQGEDFLL